MEIEFSVIVPVHRLDSEYLHPCLESILNQTVCNFELICIVDDPKDALFPVQDSRLIVHKIPPCTIGHARNEGLKIAKGHFVTFVDSDDALDADFFAKMQRAIELNPFADIVYTRPGGGEPHEGNCPYRRLSGKEAELFQCGWLSLLSSFDTTFCLMNVWGKAFRRGFIEKNGIHFPKQRMTGEDCVFIMRCVGRASEIVLDSANTSYHYRADNPQSALHQKKALIINVDCFYKSLISEYQRLNSPKLSARLARYISWHFLIHIKQACDAPNHAERKRYVAKLIDDVFGDSFYCEAFAPLSKELTYRIRIENADCFIVALLDNNYKKALRIACDYVQPALLNKVKRFILRKLFPRRVVSEKSSSPDCL